MELKARFSQIGYVLIGLWLLFYAAMAFLGYGLSILLIFKGLSLFVVGAKPFTYTVTLGKDKIRIVWYKYFIKRTITKDIQLVTLEIIYAGSTNKPADAILNVFVGKRCAHQVPAANGFEEADFRKLIVRLEKLKLGNGVV
ncbi:hypothetical protein [Chitinophaga rhizophila]|uniref:PH domain-containing protein n=1 Tax=Chitinophaga rhizophila TaxID=2866212 RepID=A0ABS7GIG5_9BACT|nr:hypothetical protein [Chitinophaga rhizophila]MBW8687474.1 hypothetical protein [Chitinophaga rhizophila]